MSIAGPHPQAAAPVPVLVGGWRVFEYEEVASTHDLAASLDPWIAVRAARQTAGRGRFERVWISDSGGLWLSAVVPLSPSTPGWEALPLVAGWVVADTVRSLGVRGLRLRWPNDVMIHACKLAGILVERPHPERAVIGIGLNVTNNPGSQNNSLQCSATRLADVLETSPPPLSELAALLLERLRRAVVELQADGFGTFTDRVNALWRRPSAVQLDLAEGSRRGWFEGITEQGALRLRAPDGTETILAAHQVRQLRELEHELEHELKTEP